MSDFLLVVIWISIIGSLIASALGIRASIRLTTWAGSPWLRIGLIATALISFTYLVSYLWLLVNPDKFVEWAEVMVVVNLLSWIIGPWILLPITLEHHIRQRAKLMRTKADELLGEVRGEISADGGS